MSPRNEGFNLSFSNSRGGKSGQRQTVVVLVGVERSSILEGFRSGPCHCGSYGPHRMADEDYLYTDEIQ